MPGPPPKSAATRQRQNRTSTAAALRPDSAEWTVARERGEVPELPPRGPRKKWNERTLTWWRTVWASPMAVEYLEADLDDLIMLAELRDDYTRLRVTDKRIKALQELRMQEQRFGLSPIDRRRLQWEVEKGEEAAERTTQRASRRAAAKRTQEKGDPREYLKSVG